MADEGEFDRWREGDGETEDIGVERVVKRRGIRIVEEERERKGEGGKGRGKRRDWSLDAVRQLNSREKRARQDRGESETSARRERDKSKTIVRQE